MVALSLVNGFRKVIMHSPKLRIWCEFNILLLFPDISFINNTINEKYVLIVEFPSNRFTRKLGKFSSLNASSSPHLFCNISVFDVKRVATQAFKASSRFPWQTVIQLSANGLKSYIICTTLLCENNTYHVVPLVNIF